HSKLLKNASTDGGLKVEKESQPFSLSYREPLAHWREKGSDPYFDFGAGIGGADRDRTGDPLLAKQVLSQLSYSPSALPHLAERYASQTSANRSALTRIGQREAHRRTWWVWEDLNFRPHPYQGCALTN